MDRFFQLSNNVALKFQEIEYGFIDGVGYLLGKKLSAEETSKGLQKLWKLKEFYETQLEQYSDLPHRIKDIGVCFRCFDKPQGECHDCD